MRVTKAVQRAGWAVLLGLAVVTCRDNPAGPGRGQRGYLALAPVLPQQAANLAAFGLSIDSLRVVVVRPPSDTLVDTTVAFAADQDSISLALPLTLEAASEIFDVALELRGSGFVLFSATASVEVEAGAPGTTPPVEISDFTFTGPGAGVTSLFVTPADSVIRLGDSLRFRVDAFIGAVPVTQFYVSWSTDNETLAPINAHGVLEAPNQRGRVLVTATTPTGVTGSAPVTFIPVPVGVAAVLPIPDDVPPGTPIGPLRAQVLAADGLGVKGIPVTFRALSGGGAVADSVVVTDSGGFAQTAATSGIAGANVFSATVTGVAAPALFNVTVVSSAGTQLAFALPPAGAVTDLPFGVVVEIRDAQGAVAIGASDPVTIALGANPGSATLSGTLTVNAVQGIAVFANLTLNQPGVGYTVVVTAPGLTQATSPPFDVIQGFTGRLWTNPAGGNWSDPANWSGGIVPVLGDTVYVSLDGDYTVTLDVNVSVGFLLFGAGSGTQTLVISSHTLGVDSGAVLNFGAALNLTNATISTAATGTVASYGTIEVAPGTSAINSQLFLNSGSVLRLVGNNGPGVLSNNGGVVNFGTIELTGQGWGGHLSVTNGTLLNGPGATLQVVNGAGNVYTGELDNQGTVQVDGPWTLAGASANHVNAGTIALAAGDWTLNQTGTLPTFTTNGSITVGPGRTWTVNGGAVDYDNASPGGLGGVGAIVFNGATLNLTPDLTHDTLTLSLTNSTVNGPGTLTVAGQTTLGLNAVTVNAALVNQGTVQFNPGANSMTGAVSNTSGALVRLFGNNGPAVVTVTNGFTNQGTIELTGQGWGGHLGVTSGTLVNAPSATFRVLNGAGNLYTGALDNQGTVQVDGPWTLDRASADHLNSGSIVLGAGDWTLNQSGTTPSFTTTGTVTVGLGRTWTVNGGAVNYQAGALGGKGLVVMGGATLGLGVSLTHDTLSLSLTTSTVNGPGTLTVAGQATLGLNAVTLNAALVNQGTVQVNPGANSFSGAVSNSSGALMRLFGNNGPAVVTVANGFTNQGTIELTGQGWGGHLGVTSGTLVNAPGATLRVLNGAGNAFTGPLDNQGTVQVDGPWTLDGASADHLNSGSIVLGTGDWTLNQSGTTPSFTTTGTVTVGLGRTWTVNSGAVTYQSGALGGKGVVALNGATLGLGVSLTHDTLSLSLTNATVNGPGTLTVAGLTPLVMVGSTLNAALVNQGTVLANPGSHSLNGAVSNSSGALLRLFGNNGPAVVTVANGFTNQGTIELTGQGWGGNLSVTSGTLVNAPGATLRALNGAGNSYDGTLNNLGTVQVDGPLTLSGASADHDNSGTVNVAGGDLTITQSGTTPTFTNQGTVAVAAGRTVATTGGAFTNDVVGTLSGSGTLNVSATTFNNNGTVAPGGSPGALTFIGTYAMSASATLSVELGGTTPGTQYDQVVVGGTGTLAGTLNVTLINGFTPSIGQVFTIVAGGNVTGVLASLNLPSVAGAIWLPNLSAAGLQLSLVSASALLPVIWTNPAGGNWSNGANWSTGTPPGPGDSAVINLGGPLTVTVDAAATAAFLDLATAVGGATKTVALAGQTLTLSGGGIVGGDGVVNLSGGTLTGGGSLQVNGALNWTSGLISGAGIVQVGPTGTMTLSGTGTKSLNSRTIQTAGTVTWSGTGTINAGGGAVVEIQPGGTFAANADAIVAHSLGGTQPRIVVDAGGTFSRSAGTGAAGLFVPFDNAGAVAVNSGTLELRGGGTNGGTFAVGGGALLDIPSGTYAFGTGTQLGGTGLVRIAGGTVNVDGATPIPVNRLQLLSGSLQGVGTLDVQDSLVWSGGTMQGAGITNIPAGADLVLNGTPLSFSARTIVNAGTVTWIAGNIFSGSGATLQNVAGGVVDLRADASWFHNMGGTPPQLANLAGGVVQRSTGIGTVDVRAAASNAGTVQVLSGTLALNGGGTSGGAFTVAPPAELSLGGTHTLTSTSSVTAAGTLSTGSGTTSVGGAFDVTGLTLITGGTLAFDAALPDTARITNLQLQSGTLGGTGVVLLRGAGTWSGGGLAGSGVLRVPVGVTLGIAGPVTMSTRTIANAGQVTWSGGNISSGLGAVLNNQSGALFDIQGAALWAHNLGGAVPLVNNAAGGVVRRSTSTGTATLNVPLTNSGTLDVQIGTLVLNAGAASSGAHAVGAGATLQYGGLTHSLTTGAAFAGLGRVVIPSGATVSIDAAAPDTVDARWIELTGGTLGGLGVLRMLDSLVWTGGQLNEAGVLRIPVSGRLLIRGTASKTFRSRTIANAGVVAWTGTGPIASGVNAALQIENGALFDLESDADWVYNQGGAVPHIDNLSGGLIKRGAATSDITVGAALNNDGTLDLQTGTVTFTNGGASKGTFLLTAPGTAGFGGGSHTLDVGSLVTGNGAFQVSAGTVTEAGDYNVTGLTRISGGVWVFEGSKPAEVTTFDLGGGSLDGTGLVNLHGAGTWTGGTMTGTGQFRVFAGASLAIDGKDPKVFTRRAILNAGLVTWQNTGSISSGSAAVLTNQPGATLELQGDASWVHNQGGVAPTVNNAGSLKRNAATGTVLIQAVVNNTGNVDVSSGTLSLAGGGSNTGLYAVSSGAVLDFGGGTHTLSGPTTRLTGAGTVTFTAGAVTLSGTAPSAYDITGTTSIDGATATFNTPDTARFTTLQLRNGTLEGTANMVVRGSGLWTAGALAAPPALPAAVVLRVPQGVVFSINGAATKQFTKRTILNFGTVNWLGGSVLAASGATLDVQPSAFFNVSAPAAWSSGAPQPFINIRDRAEMHVTTAGTTTLGAGVVFNNQGTLDIAAGATLKVAGDLNELSTSTLQGRGTLDVVGNSKVVNQGTVRPGNSPGVLTVLGNWPQGPGTTLVIDVEGFPTGGAGIAFDRFVVSGLVTTGGALRFEGPVGFRPAGAYTIMTFGTRTGQTFAPLSVINIPVFQLIDYTVPNSVVVVWP